MPAWRHSGAALLAGLHERSRSATPTSSSARARKLLVAAQLVAVVVLLTVAGLFIRSFTALLRLDLGFDLKSSTSRRYIAPSPAPRAWSSD